MKKTAIGCLISILFLSCSLKRETNWNWNYNRNSKDPFGCFIAYQSLKDLFPYATINAVKNPMETIQSSNQRGVKGEMVIAISEQLIIDSIAWSAMKTYLENGNDVVLFSTSIPLPLAKDLQIQMNEPLYLPLKGKASFPDNLMPIPVTIDCFKQRYQCELKGVGTIHTWNTDSIQEDNFSIWGYAGKLQQTNLLTWYHQGTLTLCSSPGVMTNYFMLNENNKEYYERFFSTFGEGQRKITWSSGPVLQMNSGHEGLWDLISKIPALKYSFLILFLLLLLYIVFESKRRQRFIPVVKPNTNSSLEFTETIGSLYYNKGDHVNLSHKMLQHYFEHIRTKYQLPTNDLNEIFASKLAAKINQPLTDTKAFLAYLEYIRSSSDISDTDIIHLHHQLKKFS